MIEIITKENCKFCNLAKKLLQENNLPYEEKKIGKDIDRDEVLSKFPNQKTVPIITRDGDLVGGYEDLVRVLSTY